jgi:glycosyltransferase involved in cell wall biosynthesis
VIFNSETSRGVAGAVTGPSRRIRVIHNGVAGPPAVGPPRVEIDCLELVYVGRLSPRKGVDVAVATLAEVSRRGIDARLSVVGSVFPGYEWYEEQLRAQAEELGLTQRVTFHGFQNDVWPYLAASDIVLVPSRADESFGNSVIEAALSARPVVVSDHTGLREAAEALTAAVRVPADDAVAVADAVDALLGDWPQARRNATRDAARAAAAYAPERYRQLVCRVIDDAAGRQR